MFYFFLGQIYSKTNVPIYLRKVKVSAICLIECYYNSFVILSIKEAIKVFIAYNPRIRKYENNTYSKKNDYESHGSEKDICIHLLKSYSISILRKSTESLAKCDSF